MRKTTGRGLDFAGVQPKRTLSTYAEYDAGAKLAALKHAERMCGHRIPKKLRCPVCGFLRWQCVCNDDQQVTP